jgi:hypothetical protein
MEKNRLYIYLARLDKSGIEVIAGFPYTRKVYPTRVPDINALGLSPTVSSGISAKARERKMTHEVYVESAASYQELKESLAERGYKNLPTHQFTAHLPRTSINESVLVTKKSTMLRRSNK